VRERFTRGARGAAALRAAPADGRERLLPRPDGLVLITLKKAYTDGTVAVDMDPLSLFCRLATSVPTPRLHTVRYAGVLAAASAPCPRGAPPLDAWVEYHLGRGRAFRGRDSCHSPGPCSGTTLSPAASPFSRRARDGEERGPNVTRIVWSRRELERDEASNDGTICVAALHGLASGTPPFASFDQLFHHHYPDIRRLLDGRVEPGLALMVVGPGGTEASGWFAAKDAVVNPLIVGRHSSAEVFLPSDPQISLRHLAVVLQRRASGARSPSGSSTSGRPWRSPTRTGRVSRRSRRAARPPVVRLPGPSPVPDPWRDVDVPEDVEPPGRRSPHASSSRRPPPPKVTARRQG